MTTLPQKKKYTPAEFLALEEKAETKSEYWNGAIVAMAGGSLNHIQITFNAAKALDRQIAGKCRTLPTEIKVCVQKRGEFYYPDITIVCGKPQFCQNRNDTIINPQILIK